MRQTKRDIIRQAMASQPTSYVPWHCSFTLEAAHAVESDVPLDNMLAFIEVLHAQPALGEISV